MTTKTQKKITEEFRVLINNKETKKIFSIPTINASYPRQILFEQFEKYAATFEAYSTVIDRAALGGRAYVLPNGDRMTVKKIEEVV